MTVISEPIKDIAGLADNAKVVFQLERPRQNAAGSGIVSPRRVPVTPVNGVLTTPDLDPGPAKVFYGTNSFDIVIPASGTVRLWPLIEQYLPVDGPQVSKAVSAAIDAIAAKEAAQDILEQVESGAVPNSAVATAVQTGATKAALDQTYAPLSNVPVDYTWDATTGSIKTITEHYPAPKGDQVTTYGAYNAFGDPTTETDPTGQVWTLSYDTNGNLSSRTKAVV